MAAGTSGSVINENTKIFVFFLVFSFPCGTVDARIFFCIFINIPPLREKTYICYRVERYR